MNKEHQLKNALERFASNNNENIDDLTLRLCCDRDFCELAEINYCDVNYEELKVEILKYRIKEKK